MFRKAPLGVYETELEAATGTRTVPERWTDSSYHCGGYRGTFYQEIFDLLDEHVHWFLIAADHLGLTKTPD